MQNSTGLVAHAVSKLGSCYMFGYTGIVTEAAIQRKAIQYPNIYTTTYIIKCRKNIGKWATDCSGLIDIYLGVDLSASGYYARATVKGPIATIPKNVPGILVFKENASSDIYHVGVCVGDGTVIEAKGIDYGVVCTALAFNGWDMWAYCHMLDYNTAQEVQDVIKKGDQGATVKALQEALLKLGCVLPQYGADGDFGDETETAVTAFQARFGLPQTGIVDATTAAKMFDALRLIPNVDVKPYSDEIARLKLSLNITISDNADLKVINDEAIGDLKTLARINRKYEV